MKGKKYMFLMRDVIIDVYTDGKGAINPHHAIRVTHIPTGIIVTSNSFRSLEMNRRNALETLERLVNEAKKSKDKPVIH